MLFYFEEKSDLCIICSHVNTMSDNFGVDSGKNSDENSTGVDATFSCEKCGQTFKSRQELKKHSSVAH
jgi:hypothetical protein